VNLLLLSEPSYPRHPGGAGKSTHLLAAGLAARGHDVRILCECREPTEREVIDGVEVHRVNVAAEAALPGQEREAAIAAAFLAYAERHIPLAALDALYDSGAFLSYFFPLAHAIVQRHGTPYVLHYRYLLVRHQAVMAGAGGYDAWSTPVLDLERMINEPSQCLPSRFADAIVCPSRSDAAYVEAMFRPAAGAPAVIPDPVETVAVDAEAARVARAELVAPGEKLVYFGGRVDSDLKGGDVVVAALERVRAARDDVRLLLLVKSDAWVEAYRRLGPALVVRPWIRDRAALAAALAAVDLVLCPSRYESFGMVGAEALAAGKPVIASPVGGMRDLITDGESGFLLSAGDRAAWPAEMSDRMLRLLGDPALAAAMGARARDAAAACAQDRVAAAVEEVCLRAREHRRAGERAAGAPVLPALPPADRARYLAELEAVAGRRARAAGEAALAAWPATGAARCPACSRQSLGVHADALVRAGKPGAPWRLSELLGARPRRIDRAVAAACPLGVLQRALIEDFC
jgi:glycosyltransferase involved in cell wall biosynthesis